MQDVKLHYDGIEFRFVQLQAYFLCKIMRGGYEQIQKHTFMAIYTLVGLCSTLFTVP